MFFQCGSVDKRFCATSKPILLDIGPSDTKNIVNNKKKKKIKVILNKIYYYLQELQNEVGALLEFRDLVIETFPDLKHKMASISASNTITGIPSSGSLASR